MLVRVLVNKCLIKYFVNKNKNKNKIIINNHQCQK